MRDAGPDTFPEVVHAPDGVPNVLMVLVDNTGFGASGSFGGPCEMPTADRLARNGLRLVATTDALDVGLDTRAPVIAERE